MRRAGPSRDHETRQHLIEAATRLFAERGYSHVTVRDICGAAAANVAAVNYHFGDKMGLYREVIDSAAAVARESTALAIRAGEGASPREQLRQYIEVLYRRLSTATGPHYLQQIIHREMTEPTGAVTALVDRLLKGRFEYLQKVVGDILNLPPSNARVTLAATTIHGLVIMYRPTPLSERVGKALHLSFTPGEITEHLVRFSLAALDGYLGSGEPVKLRHRGSRRTGAASSREV